LPVNAAIVPSMLEVGSVLGLSRSNEPPPDFCGRAAGRATVRPTSRPTVANLMLATSEKDCSYRKDCELRRNWKINATRIERGRTTRNRRVFHGRTT
jgi:hypothetical protein